MLSCPNIFIERASPLVCQEKHYGYSCELERRPIMKRSNYEMFYLKTVFSNYKSLISKFRYQREILNYLYDKQSLENQQTKNVFLLSGNNHQFILLRKYTNLLLSFHQDLHTVQSVLFNSTFPCKVFKNKRKREIEAQIDFHQQIINRSIC